MSCFASTGGILQLQQHMRNVSTEQFNILNLPFLYSFQTDVHIFYVVTRIISVDTYQHLFT